MPKKIVNVLTEDCIEAIELHDTDALSSLMDSYGVDRFYTYSIMYHVCKIGCFDSFKLLVNNGICPNITETEWAAVGKNEHQKDIFDYIVNVYTKLPFHDRDYTSLRVAFKKQPLSVLKKLLSICIFDAKKNDRIGTLAQNYPKIMFISASNNHSSVTQYLINVLNEDETLSIAVDEAISSLGYSSIDHFVNRKIIPNVIKKRQYKTMALLSSCYRIKDFENSDSLIKKSYSDDKISELFYALPIMERHGMLKGMVSTGKHKLAIALFESMPKEHIATDSEPLAKLLRPVIKAYDTDPLSFFWRDDIPDEWLPSLTLLVSQ